MSFKTHFSLYSIAGTCQHLSLQASSKALRTWGLVCNKKKTAFLTLSLKKNWQNLANSAFLTIIIGWKQKLNCLLSTALTWLLCLDLKKWHVLSFHRMCVPNLLLLKAYRKYKNFAQPLLLKNADDDRNDLWWWRNKGLSGSYSLLLQRGIPARHPALWWAFGQPPCTKSTQKALFGHLLMHLAPHYPFTYVMYVLHWCLVSGPSRWCLIAIINICLQRMSCHGAERRGLLLLFDQRAMQNEHRRTMAESGSEKCVFCRISLLGYCQLTTPGHSIYYVKKKNHKNVHQRSQLGNHSINCYLRSHPPHEYRINVCLAISFCLKTIVISTCVDMCRVTPANGSQQRALTSGHYC